MTTATSPIVFDPTRSEAIPQDLRARRQWVLWRYGRSNGRVTKIPHQALSPSLKASSTNPQTWAPFEKTVEVYKKMCNPTPSDGSMVTAKEYVDGIGFMFSADDPYTGADIDDCIDSTGSLHPEAKKLILEFNSYTEISPRGRGVKIWIRGEFKNPNTGNPGGRSSRLKWCKEIEIYSANRYFTMTGHQLEIDGLATSINDSQAALNNLSANLWPSKAPPKNRNADACSITDEELLQKARTAKNGAEFSSLFDHGDLSAYSNDASRADLALCCKLAFWVGNDPDRIERLFRRSALFREKWNREDYSKATIQKGIEGCNGEFYGHGDGERQGRDKSQRKTKVDGSDLPGLTRNKDGNPVRSLANLELILTIDKKWKDRLWMNEMGNTEMLVDPNTEKSSPVDDADYFGIRQDLETRYGLSFNQDVPQAIFAVCKKRIRHPVREYLKGLEWDGKQRLNNLLGTILVPGEKSNSNMEVSKEMIRLFFIQAVARVFDPGCKADSMLVLYGPQGVQKSTFLSIIAKEWFLDTSIDPHSRDFIYLVV